MPAQLRHQHRQANPAPAPETEEAEVPAAEVVHQAAEAVEVLEVPVQRKGSLSSMVRPADSD